MRGNQSVDEGFRGDLSFSGEEGSKTLVDKMFLGLSTSSNLGVPVVTWGVEDDEPDQ